MSTNREKILIIDDDAEVRSLVSGVLSDEGYQTHTASNEQESISAIKSCMPDLIFLDLWIGSDESGGFKILSKIKNINADIPVVVISGHGTIDIAMKAMKKGAFDFLEKPFVIDRLLLTCSHALEFCKLRRENRFLQSDRINPEIFSAGTSLFASSIKTVISKVAASNCRVFLSGPVGSGLDSIAYRIHKESAQKDRNFVCVSCSESDSFADDFFGTDKFYGYVEKARGGTIFLENVNLLSSDTQRKLLMLIQNDRIPLRSRTVFLDSRIISSITISKNITEVEQLSKFSQELLYRLKISTINVPSLADRREDIIPIIDWYISEAKKLFGLNSKPFTSKALAILQAYDWPGNIQQVKNTVENALINATSLNKLEIDEEALPSEITAGTQKKCQSVNIAEFIGLSLKEAKEHFEYEYLKAQIERFSGNISKTADFIGMERSALHRKLKALDVEYTRNNKHCRGNKSTTNVSKDSI